MILARVRPSDPSPAAPVPPAASDPQGEWVRRHQRAPWRLLRLLGCPAHLADDLVQDALLAALHKGIDRRPDPEAQGWLRAAVRNLWRMHLRTQRRRPPHVDLELAEAALLRHDGEGAEGARSEAFLAALQNCLGTLDGRARRAIELRYGEEASREAMAASLGLTPDGVKTLLRRLRDSLFDCVQRRLRHAEERA